MRTGAIPSDEMAHQSPSSCIPIITMVATQKKRISGPLSSTDLGYHSNESSMS